MEALNASTQKAVIGVEDKAALATKADITELRLATKADIDELRSSLILWVVPLLLGQAIVFAWVVKSAIGH